MVRTISPSVGFQEQLSAPPRSYQGYECASEGAEEGDEDSEGCSEGASEGGSEGDEGSEEASDGNEGNEGDEGLRPKQHSVDFQCPFCASPHSDEGQEG